MSARKGFSLIEVMVALTMLAIVLLSLAKISMAIGLRSRTNDIVAKRTAALQAEANKFGSIPYSTLATWPTATVRDTLGTFIYDRKLSITNTGTTRYTIKITVTPVRDATKKDSIILDRTLPPTSSPLCKGC